MNKPFHYYVASIALCAIMASNAATLLVTNLLDDGSPGSLRETIANASGGDTIKFSVAGTILLNEALGELVVDKQLIIDGQFKITVDGQNQINIGFHVTGGSASNTIIQNITIQNFNGHEVNPGSGTEPQELPAYGILIENNADNCSVIATTIKHIHSGVDEEAAGIAITNYPFFLNVINIINNTVMFISSEDNPAGSSGLVFGISDEAITTQDCSNNTIYNLASGSARDSGSTFGIFAISIENNCSYNTIYNLASGPAIDDSGEIFGMFIGTIGNNCTFNTIYNFTSGNASTDDSGSITGIGVLGGIGGNCSHNTLHGFTSGNASDNSGSITGIVVTNSIDGQCSHNNITTFTSGNAGDRAGELEGIIVFFMNGPCSNNTIMQFTIGNISPGTQVALGRLLGIEIDVLRADCLNNHIADLSANGSSILSVGGILLESIDGNHLVACNTVERITGGPGSTPPFGMQIAEGNNIIVKNNIIASIVGTGSTAHGILLEDTAGVTFVTNSLLSFNTIHNIMGAANNGFGITIAQAGSIGNDLLNNSIFSINGKAINIIDNGVPVDGTVTLQSVVCSKRKLFIQGSLQPAIGLEQSDFLIQFFVSDNNIPPQTMTFLGEQIIAAQGSSTDIPFFVELKSCASTSTNTYITATATALPQGTNNNTSEVSNSIPGCNNTDLICNIATTTCDLTPPACPILIAQ